MGKVSQVEEISMFKNMKIWTVVLCIVALSVWTGGSECRKGSGGGNGTSSGSSAPPPLLAGWTQTSNPSSNYDRITSLVADDNYLYIAGWDSSLGETNAQWRIEKRAKASGNLVSVFGNNGVITSNPSISADVSSTITIDADYLYIGGSDSTPGNSGRIEKRAKTNGALVSAFGNNGVITSNVSISIIADADYLYIAEGDGSLGAGNSQCRIEKRSKISGNLVSAFGNNGVITINPSPDNDGIEDMTADNAYLYITIHDEAPPLALDVQWHIEKRSKTDGSLVWVVTFNPTDFYVDKGTAIIEDSDYLYIGGYENAGVDNNLRIEKRAKADGNLVSAFGDNGVIIYDPGPSFDWISDITVDTDYLYLVGYSALFSNSEWRIEKRSKTNGALVSAFGTNGVITSNPSTSSDEINAITIDTDYLYIAGYDSIPGNPQWRIEKRLKTSGEQ
jgi:hypothetical protein